MPLAIVSLAAVFCGVLAAQVAPVPPEFQSLYPVLQTDLDTFQQTLDGLWNKQASPIGFGADLLSANSNVGSALLGASTQAAVTGELASMQKLGITTAAVTVHFPIVYAPYFLSSQGGLGTGNTADQYISFYQFVVATAHAMNPPMKVAMETYVNWSSGVIPGLPNLLTYYQSLGLNGYMAARAAMAVTIAQQIQPDFLSLQAEPDTEALQSGYSQFKTPSNDIQLVSGMVTALENANPPIIGLHTLMKISAGIGTWDWVNYQSLIQAEATMPGLDDLTMHILPVNVTTGNSCLMNALSIIQLAQQNQKGLAMPQAWLNKMYDSEASSGVGSAMIYGRNVYSFWEPLDQEFLQIITKLGYYGSFDFISAFWGDWFFYLYLDYSGIAACPYNPNANPPSSGYPDATCSGTTLQNVESALAGPIRQIGGPLTEVGTTYEQLIGGHFLPEITSGPAISPFPITGKQAQLSVTANDGAGGSNVTYLWQVTGTPPANPVIATPAEPTTNVLFSAAGTYSFQVTVTGSDGLAVIRPLQFTVAFGGTGSPVITSSRTAQGPIGSAFSYQITANPAATSFAASGLPAGLAINSTTGLISGVPQVSGTFSVALAASNSVGMGTAALTLTINLVTGGAIYRIDCGSSTSYTDPGGNLWSADEDFTGGATVSTTKTISGTTTPVIYQTARQGTPTYSIPVQNGSYTVVLKFAEIVYGSAGKRQFNAAINGTQVLTNFDIVAAAGAANTAVDESFPVTVTGGTVTIQFTNGAATAPLINGIEIVTANPAGTPVITSPLTAQGTTGTAFSYQITAKPAATNFNALGLPCGLTLNASSGLISGTPRVSGTYSVALSASNANGVGTATLSLAINQPPLGTAVYLIDSGSSSSYTDPAGNVWSADMDFTGGATASTTNAISGTTTPVVYQTARQGTPTYTLPVVNGAYTVVLKFAEIQYPYAGERNFNVAINGTQVLSDFDIVAAAGAAYTAVDEPFPVTVTGGTITIQFTSGTAGVPLINGIEVLTASVALSPVITSPLTAQGTEGTAFNYQITASPAATSFNALGLPSGLKLNASSGLISGTPSVWGSFSVALSASNADGTGLATLTLTLNQAPPGTAIYRIDSGNSSSYTDPVGNVWSADMDFAGGITTSTTKAISGTTTPVVYQTARLGTPTYTLPVHSGDYTVVLKFAEIQYSATGKRLFNVAINGTQVLTNFDIVAAAGGANTAVDKSFPVAVSGGTITIQFTNGTAATGLINGLAILTAP